MTKAECAVHKFREGERGLEDKIYSPAEAFAECSAARDRLEEVVREFGISPEDCRTSIVYADSGLRQGITRVLRRGREGEILNHMTQINALVVGTLHVVRDRELGPGRGRIWVVPLMTGEMAASILDAAVSNQSMLAEAN